MTQLLISFLLFAHSSPCADDVQRSWSILVVDEEHSQSKLQVPAVVPKWKIELFRFVRVLFAPKLEYKLERLLVYSNGVWGDYSITNWSARNKYLDTRFLEAPFRGMTLVDSNDQQWQVPQEVAWDLYGIADSFVAIRPGTSISFRAKLSSADRSLEISRAPADVSERKPRTVHYNISCWTSTYSTLANQRPTSESTYAFGTGEAAVEFTDKEYSKDWAIQQRRR